MKKFYLLLSLLIACISFSFSQNTGTDILNYSIAGQAGATFIDSENDSIHIVMLPQIQNLQDRVASFSLSEGATAKIGANIQISEETENDYSNGPLIYNVTSEDGTERDWTVVVSYYYNQFSSFSIAGQDSSGYCGADTLCVWMPSNTDLSSLIADFTISGYAGEVLMDETAQVSGVTVNDWSDLSLNYIVLSDAGVEKEYTVIIHLNDALESMFYSFQVGGQDSSEYDYENNTIEIIMPAGTIDLTNLVANFSLADAVTVTVDGITQVPGETINDWSSGTLIYNIETANRSVIQWIINLDVSLYSGNDILTYAFPNIYSINTDHTDSIIILMGPGIIDISNLIAEFTLSEGAKAFLNGVEQISGETANDFSINPLTYKIQAENGTLKEWKILVDLGDWVNIEERGNSNLLKVFPNPNNGTLNLSIDLKDIQTFNIEVFNTSGKLVKQIEAINNRIENAIDLSTLNSGLYYIKVKTETKTLVQKISIIK